MRQIELTTVREKNGSLSLWIKDIALGKTGEHRGALRLAENPNHDEFYQAVKQAISDYEKGGDSVNFIDAAPHR